MARDKLATFEGNQIARFRNFSGEAEGPYDTKGKRYFNLLLDPAEASAMEADGINVKYLKPYDEGDEPQAHVKVKIVFGNKFRADPIITLVTRRDGQPIGQTELIEQTLMVADFAEIDPELGVDCQIRIYDWEMKNGSSGVGLEVRKMWINIAEDKLTRKYIDVPKMAIGAGPQLELEGGADPDLGELTSYEYAEIEE